MLKEIQLIILWDDKGYLSLKETRKECIKFLMADEYLVKKEKE